MDIAAPIKFLFKDKTSGDVNIEVSYQTKIKADMGIKEYSVIQESYRLREMESGISLFGPHKDDILFLSDGVLFKDLASLGQMRIAGIVLKVIQVQEMMKRGFSAPILLLDDVFFELDPQHRSVFKDYFHNGFSGMQIFECVNDKSMKFGNDIQVINLE